MTGKWRIRKEIKQTAALIAISVLIAFTGRQQEAVVLQSIEVQVENAHENHFIDEADVLRLLNHGRGIKGVHVSRLNLREIEEKIKYDEHIEDCDLYGDLKGNLTVRVTLRRPVARIVQNEAPDAYIAEDGTTMSTSDKYTARVLLVSGAVKPLLELGNLRRDDTGRLLMDMIQYINRDEFWRAQIAQIHLDRHGRVTMYPQVTNQRIEFGKLENMEIKFRKLRIFYKDILPQRGWTTYQRINLEYEGQVIAE